MIGEKLLFVFYRKATELAALHFGDLVENITILKTSDLFFKISFSTIQ